MLDFDVSGNMAYTLADVRYHVAATPGVEPVGDVTAESVIVFYRAGARWKIRTYVERPRGQ
jgi:hypothetical protein